MDARRMEAVTEAPKAATVIRVGSQVWMEDPQVAWIAGEVVEIIDQEVIVQTVDGKLPPVNLSKVHPRDSKALPQGVEDMTELAYLHEPGVLQNLASRYKSDQIYTYIGSTLIVINPFRRLRQLYGTQMMGKYKEAKHCKGLSPHVYAVAEAAYRAMINDEKSQSILVSGESGAGKTESTKRIMEYLAYKGGRAANKEISAKVLKSIPLLEAFGNAKTVRNNNSSRFGKLVELQFDKNGRISGAYVRTFLLERSRVCRFSDEESNYHCFYLLCAAPPEDIEKYKLGLENSFHYLKQSNCNEAKRYRATREAMEVVGITPEEQDAIFRVVAAILHLGNVDFTLGEDNDSSKLKDEKARFHLKMAADLFMCDDNKLEACLCKRVIGSPKEPITTFLKPADAVTSRDALAKLVYSRLFDWLVDKINKSIGQDPNSKTIIGVLDMCGFESFEKNSFEQFCMNLANEKLQQHFNQHVFNMEQDEYRREGINGSGIEFSDNQDVLDLIEKKPGGIIALLDEACVLPKPTHENFAQNLYKTFKNNKRFIKPKGSCTDFTIRQYGGDVTYQTNLFLDKNNDYVVVAHQNLLSSSKCTFVAGLFPAPPEEPFKNANFFSVGTRFKEQLQSLLNKLSLTNPYYIRCLKPNKEQEPCNFENHNILQQLHCGGVMEVIRISCAGYPIRLTFDEFVYHFGMHAPKASYASYDEKTAIKNLLENMGLQHYQIGKTKIFLRTGQMVELDAHILGSKTTTSNIIQDPKTRLEKQVEELTYGLQLEKSIRADLEASKSQVEAQVRETNILLEKEREEIKKAMEKEKKKYVDSQNLSEEQLRKVKEAESKIEKLKNTLEEMKSRVRETNSLLEKEKDTTKRAMEKLDEDKKKYVEFQKLSEEQIRNAKDKLIHQQHLITTVIQTLENGYHELEEPDI